MPLTGPGWKVLSADGKGHAAAAIKLPLWDSSSPQGAAHCSQTHPHYWPTEPYVYMWTPTHIHRPHAWTGVKQENEKVG